MKLLLRIVAASAGAYVVTALAMAFLARSLPMERADAVITATLAGFPLMAGLAMLVFARRGKLRQSMASMHTWTGLVVCWLLLLVFFTGTAAYYRDEITRWSQPELHGAELQSVSPVLAAAAAQRALQEKAPKAKRWDIVLPDVRTPYTQVRWGEKGGAQLDPGSGTVLPKPRETYGGDFFFRLHFDLHYMPKVWGRWIVGIAAMLMFISLFSGVITHRRIFTDFFTFRTGKGQRSWLDAHNAAGVLALPFHLVITYTGLVTLMFMYLPSPKDAVYHGDQKTWLADAYPTTRHKAKPSGEAAAMPAFGPLVEKASMHWGGAAPERIEVQAPNDRNALIGVVRAGGSQLSNSEATVYFNAKGEQVASLDYPGAAATDARRALYGLHVGRFADPALRALIFLCSALGCVMVATGALLWAAKRKEAAAAGRGRAHFGHRLVDGLNIGTIAGLPLAFAAFLWANRVLPAIMAGRAEAEVALFFVAWGGALVLGLAHPSRLMWRLLFGAAALLWAAVGLVDAVRPGAMLGFDAALVAFALAWAFAAWRAGRSQPGSAKRATAPAAVPAACVTQAAAEQGVAPAPAPAAPVAQTEVRG